MQENKLPCHTKVIQSDIILVFVNSVFWNFQPHYLRHKLLSVFISLGLFSLAAWVLYRKVFLVRQKRLWDKVKNSRDIIAKFWEQKKNVVTQLVILQTFISWKSLDKLIMTPQFCVVTLQCAIWGTRQYIEKLKINTWP